MLHNLSPTSFEILHSPLHFLQAGLSDLPQPDWLREYESWWEREGQGISAAVDRSGTPWLRMFDRFGARVDEVLYSPEYWCMLKHGYQAGMLWRVFEEDSLFSAYLGIYVTSFYDPGLSCPYTVSLATIAPLSKYGDPELQKRFLPSLLRRDESVWQGATWMTEIKGGSDLGAAVETVAQPAGSHWLLTGDKYFASNAGAELAVVAARPEGAPRNVRGLGLYLVPRHRADGQLNYFIRRIKDKIATRSVPTGEIELRDSEAWLLGRQEDGIYLILEVLNLSRVANSIGSVALAQRAMADALSFAERRMVFGKPLIEQPLIRRQFEERFQQLQAASRLGWEAVELLNQVWRERPPYSDRYHLFRLVAHLAKYWTAELAVQTAKWAMEVHGGVGTLEEYHVERWLREAPDCRAPKRLGRILPDQIESAGALAGRAFRPNLVKIQRLANSRLYRIRRAVFSNPRTWEKKVTVGKNEITVVNFVFDDKYGWQRASVVATAGLRDTCRGTCLAPCLTQRVARAHTYYIPKATISRATHRRSRTQFKDRANNLLRPYSVRKGVPV